MLERATRNLKTRQALTLKTQTRLNSSSKKPEKFVLLEPLLEILEQTSRLIYAMLELDSLKLNETRTRYKVSFF